jgi:hypothetical protein
METQKTILKVFTTKTNRPVAWVCGGYNTRTQRGFAEIFTDKHGGSPRAVYIKGNPNPNSNHVTVGVSEGMYRVSVVITDRGLSVAIEQIEEINLKDEQMVARPIWTHIYAPGIGPALLPDNLAFLQRAVYSAISYAQTVDAVKPFWVKHPDHAVLYQ